jgi:hypothetical protein
MNLSDSTTSESVDLQVGEAIGMLRSTMLHTSTSG